MSNDAYQTGLALGAIKAREQFVEEANARGGKAMTEGDLHGAYAAYQEVARHERRIDELRADPSSF